MTAPTRPPRRRFPKKLPCLVCSRSRISEGPGDRIHAKCRSRGQSEIELRSALSSDA